MMMRYYFGLGVGHTYAHLSSTSASDRSPGGSEERDTEEPHVDDAEYISDSGGPDQFEQEDSSGDDSEDDE